MAIAYDSTSQKSSGGYSTGTSMTWSHTCSGTNRYLIVGYCDQYANSNTVSSITYAGVPMTLLKYSGGQPMFEVSLYGLANPATGANDIVTTSSVSSSYIQGNAVSYTGVAQVGQPDSSNSGYSYELSLSISTTVVASDSWVVGLFHTASTVTSQTGITLRSNNSTIHINIGDSNAGVSTGSYTMTENTADSTGWGGTMVSISPYIPPPPLTTNLISYWKLDESSGNASDSVGSNTATNSNVTYSAGKINNGAVFNGSSSYLQIANHSSLNFVSVPFTISQWVYNSGNTSPVRLYDKSQAGRNNGYGINFNNTYITLLGSTNLTVTNSNSTGAWNHFVCVSDGSTAYIYKDGSLIGSGAYSSSLAYTGTAQIGKASDATSYFNGSIDEVGIWSRALTSTEVATLYNGGAGLQYPFSTFNPSFTRRRLLL